MRVFLRVVSCALPPFSFLLMRVFLRVVSCALPPFSFLLMRVLLRVVSLPMHRRDTCSVPSLGKETKECIFKRPVRETLGKETKRGKSFQIFDLLRRDKSWFLYARFFSFRFFSTPSKEPVRGTAHKGYDPQKNP